MKPINNDLPLIDAEGEVRELLPADMKKFKPASEVLPSVVLGFKKMRGEQKFPKKIATTVRFSSDVLAYFKGTGKGWQTRMNAVLEEYVASH